MHTHYLRLYEISDRDEKIQLMSNICKTLKKEKEKRQKHKIKQKPENRMSESGLFLKNEIIYCKS